MSEPLSKQTFASLDLSKNKPPLVVVQPDTPIHTALQTLAKTKLINLPIASHNNSDKVYAVIGILDIVSYVIRKVDAVSTAGGVVGEGDVGGISSALMDSVEQTLSLDADDESYLVWERDLYDTLDETLRAFSSGVHRALITDHTKKHAPFLLGQYDILRILSTSPNITTAIDLESTDLLTVLSSKRKTAPVLVTVPATSTALEGFRRMQKAKTTSVAVVVNTVTDTTTTPSPSPSPRTGILAAVLSAKDLRNMTAETLETLLNRPVLEFIATVTDLTKGTPTVVSPHVSLLDGIRILVASRIHHLWVVDAERRPIGVVSQSDIIGLVSYGFDHQK